MCKERNLCHVLLGLIHFKIAVFVVKDKRFHLQLHSPPKYLYECVYACKLGSVKEYESRTVYWLSRQNVFNNGLSLRTLD